MAGSQVARRNAAEQAPPPITTNEEEGAQTAQPTTTAYAGQLTLPELRAIIQQNREQADRNRAEFLKAHPGYQPCSVPGCQGLVGPGYMRTAPDGTTYGFCPRRSVHARLAPSLFGPRAR